MFRKQNIALIGKSAILGLVFVLGSFFNGSSPLFVEEIENLEKRTQEEKLKDAAIADDVQTYKTQAGGNDDNDQEQPEVVNCVSLSIPSTGFHLTTSNWVSGTLNHITTPLYLLYCALKIPLL